MLDEIKKSYYENANAVDGWRKMSGNDLCFKYLDCDKSLSDNYLSAIIYKFWPVATKGYYSQGLKLASQEECYNWLIDSIQYVLEHHVWTDPNHQLYNDKKAPEKAINVVFTSTKINYFVALTRQKRSINSNSISLDAISKEASDSYFLPVYDDYNLFETELTDYVKECYNQYKYFEAVFLDLVLNEDLITKSDDFEVRYKKLRSRLKCLDDNYAKLFSALYGLDYEDVKKTIKYISSLGTSTVYIKIEKCMYELKRDKKILNIIE